MTNKNTFIKNPASQNNLVYGSIPEIKFRDDYFVSGDIFLRYGEHRGPNKGFGVVHIWAEHEKELKQIGYNTEDDVPRFVMDIIKPRSRIFCEFNSMRGNHRLAILKSKLGIVYVELKQNSQNEQFYSVVTAFPKGKARGTEIGSTR